MKKLTRKLFISILSMAFAVIAIGTTTFAWITISNTATVSQFEGKVETGEGGIALSWDQQTWTNVLDVADDNFTGFKGYDSTNGLSDITWTGQKFQELVISDNKAVYEDIAENKKHYLEFSFFIKNTNPSGGSLKIEIDSSKVLFGHAEGDSGDYTPDVEVDGDKNPVDNLFVDNAARMKISTDSTTLLYQKENGTDGNTLGGQTDGWAQKYFEAKGISLESLSAPSGLGTIYDSTSLDQTIIAELESDVVEITVCVWVEGWDAECHAQILKQTLTAALGLTATKVSGTN